MRATGGSLPCAHHLLVSITKKSEKIDRLIVLRVRPTTGRYPANILFSPCRQHNLVFYIIAVVVEQLPIFIGSKFHPKTRLSFQQFQKLGRVNGNPAVNLRKLMTVSSEGRIFSGKKASRGQTITRRFSTYGDWTCALRAYK